MKVKIIKVTKYYNIHEQDEYWESLLKGSGTEWEDITEEQYKEIKELLDYESQSQNEYKYIMIQPVEVNNFTIDKIRESVLLRKKAQQEMIERQKLNEKRQKERLEEKRKANLLKREEKLRRQLKEISSLKPSK